MSYVATLPKTTKDISNFETLLGVLQKAREILCLLLLTASALLNTRLQYTDHPSYSHYHSLKYTYLFFNYFYLHNSCTGIIGNLEVNSRTYGARLP